MTLAIGQAPVRFSAACTGCGACLLTCPEHVVRPTGRLDVPLIALVGCTGCLECVEICPADAIDAVGPIPDQPSPASRSTLDRRRRFSRST